ncbi:hypothetical protein IV203_005486 [Nitzschia inconspicua]|uniref:Uncharacterized protein n=1 Tax=Nitzschia inconspicua TaxID=303405 RepID=A0A9K3KMG7_9STRA|nr:hypothetical protein IV203_005486 [Nitzschia inconspicua]
MEWHVGQTVQVQSRTWAGINKPGGCAKITKVHYTVDGNYIEGLDVKYLVGGGCEKHLDPAIVSPFEMLERGGRKRRGREFLHERVEDVKGKGGVVKDGEQPRVGRDVASSPSNKAAVPGAGDAAAAAAQSSSSRQSITTSFSTPQRQRRSQKKCPPKKVTPIPKLVKIGKKSDTVSPMTEDRDLGIRNDSQQQREKSSVARGLCFDTVTEHDARKETNNIECKLRTNPPPDATKFSPKKTPPPQRGGVENTRNATMNDNDDRKPAARPTMSTNVTTSVSSSTKKKVIGVRLKTTTGLVASRSGPVNRPMKQSFSRTTSAYTTSSGANMHAVEASRKPLLDVYRDEVKKARAFMDEMVAVRSDDIDLGGSPSEDSRASGRFIRTDSRYDEFLSTLRTVWMRVEDEEVNEERFKSLFHQLTSNTFTPGELDGHIESLCKEGKLMKSDGMLYKID